MSDTTAVDGKAIADQARADKHAEQEAMSEAERKKRRIMEARTKKTVMVEFDGETFQFRVLDGEEKDFIEDLGMMFAGASEEEALQSADADEYKNARDRITEMLADHCTEDAFDVAFWKQCYGGGERVSILQQIIEQQNDAGN